MQVAICVCTVYMLGGVQPQSTVQVEPLLTATSYNGQEPRSQMNSLSFVQNNPSL